MSCYTLPGYAKPGYFDCPVVNTPLPPELIIVHKNNLKQGILSNKRRQTPGVIFSENVTFPKYSYPVLGCLVGFFEQGKMESEILSTVQEFYFKYGFYNTIDSLSAISYLQYAPNLLVKRVVGQNSTNAYASSGFENIGDYFIKSFDDVTEELINEGEYLKVFAQTPGKWGDDLTVAIFTQEESLKNSQITQFYKADDITASVPYLNYCVAVFNDNKIVEVLTVPINRLEDINRLSEYIYIKSKISVSVLGVYDGNVDIYNGNLDVFDGGSTLYDGAFGLFDGDICFIDGNVKKPLFCVPKFFDERLLKLSGGVSEYPQYSDFIEAREELDNIFNYDIDLNICNNIPLNRDDIINIVSTPTGVENSIDFAETYFMRNSDIPKDNVMFIYGEKKVGKKVLGLAGDYCGLRSKTIVEDGIGVSTSKISKLLSIDKLVHVPTFLEQELLYENMINPVVKDNGNFFINGELLYKETI